MDRPTGKYRLAERLLIRLVEAGEWEIDDKGRIWRTRLRKGLKAGGIQIVSCNKRRVEHRLPAGYLQVRAMLDGLRVYGLAHRLVWQRLHGDIPPGIEINHENGLKDDNRPSNLLRSDASGNMRHAHANGLKDQHGEKNPVCKLSDNEVAQIRLAYSKGGYTMEELAQRFGVRFQHVSRLVRGQRRPKQGGPIADGDLRHSVCDQDPETGRFVSKKRAGRLLDGREWSEFPDA